MSATRSPKVSERVAPKPADPQPKKKNTTKTTARISPRCCVPGSKAIVPACSTACVAWASNRSAAFSPAW